MLQDKHARPVGADALLGKRIARTLDRGVSALSTRGADLSELPLGGAALPLVYAHGDLSVQVPQCAVSAAK